MNEQERETHLGLPFRGLGEGSVENDLHHALERSVHLFAFDDLSGEFTNILSFLVGLFVVLVSYLFIFFSRTHSNTLSNTYGQHQQLRQHHLDVLQLLHISQHTQTSFDLSFEPAIIGQNRIELLITDK